jgi:hypothetical protein
MLSPSDVNVALRLVARELGVASVVSDFTEALSSFKTSALSQRLVEWLI